MSIYTAKELRELDKSFSTPQDFKKLMDQTLSPDLRVDLRNTADILKMMSKTPSEILERGVALGIFLAERKNDSLIKKYLSELE